MLFSYFGKGLLLNMKHSKPVEHQREYQKEYQREYQIIRLFTILGVLTLITVLFFKMLLFTPQSANMDRAPTHTGN